jgi:hypothetical protein
MKKKPPLFLYIILAILTGCTLAAFLSGVLDTAGPFTDAARLWKRIVWPLMRLTVFISIGLFVGQFIEGMGWTDRLSVMARPFMRCMSFHKEGKIGVKEITLSVLLNTFPSFFLHIPTTFFILLPLAGRAGAAYLLLTFGAALLRLEQRLPAHTLCFPNHQGITMKRQCKIRTGRNCSGKRAKS